jgi:hypothetical protein
MDNTRYIDCIHIKEGKNIGYQYLGRLKDPSGRRKSQDRFLLTSIHSQRRKDGSWFTEQTYTYNENGWDTFIYPQAHHKLTLFQKIRRWFFFNG